MPKFHTLETRLKMSKSAMGNKNAVGITPSAETREKIRLTKLGAKNPNYGKSTWNKGKTMSEESRRKLSDAKKGKPSPLKGKKGKPLTDEAKRKLSLYFRGRFKGEKSPNWKGGLTPESFKIRNSVEYKEWRFAVFKRDDFRCLYCGEKGKELNADHIYPFANYPRLRLDINNGQTLCVDCHRKTPTYAGKSVHFKPKSLSPIT